MATKKRVIRKKMKEPDQFITFSTKAMKYINENRKELTLAIGVAVVAIIISIVIYSVLKTQKEEASFMFGQISEIMQKPVIAKEEAKEQELPEGFETYETMDKKIEDAMKAINSLKDKYSSSSVSKLATLYKSSLYLQDNKIDDAVMSAELYLKEQSDSSLNFLAQEILGYSYETKGDKEKALGMFENMSKTENKIIKAYGIYHSARILESLNKIDEAKDKYNEIVKDYADFPVKAQAENRLTVLNM